MPFVVAFFFFSSYQFHSPDSLEGAAGQECRELNLACSPNGSPCSMSAPSWFPLRCSRKWTFLLSPLQNRKQSNWFIPRENAHMESQIDSMCKGSIFFFLALYCLVGFAIKNMHTLISVPGDSDEERLNLQHVPSTFPYSTFHSLPPLTVYVCWYNHFLFHACKSSHMEKNLSELLSFVKKTSQSQNSCWCRNKIWSAVTFC